jgi:hypothetical protein
MPGYQPTLPTPFDYAGEALGETVNDRVLCSAEHNTGSPTAKQTLLKCGLNGNGFASVFLNNGNYFS